MKRDIAKGRQRERTKTPLEQRDSHDFQMEVRTVDPRDQTWQLLHPAYRVYFHDDQGASDEYEVTGGDVTELIDWASSKRAGRSYVLYACVPRNGLGLVRLAGTDPNDRGTPPIGVPTRRA